ncbi:MAG: aminotransferase class V-fold PLP-dependent enzyme [Calditrichaeota bacterium]|nr:aminotransferase class V-fold PLP-dependent enzyme [Calditrichota bacterium]
MSMNLADVRGEFSHTRKMVYLEHAAVAPLPVRTVQAMQTFLTKRHAGPVKFDEENIAHLAQLRQKLAQLIQADSADRIALVPNTSTGINIFAQGFPFQPGDRILIPSIEFPSNVYPYLNLRRKGVKVDFLPVSGKEITREIIAPHFTPHTRVLAISFVQFTNGFRANLKELADFCHARGAFLAVDGIQGVGALQMNVRDWDIDFLAAGGHKWLLSPMGTGFAYLAPALLEKISPAFAGWLSVENPWNLLDFQLRFLSSAQKFELGTTNILGFRGMSESLDLFLEFGPKAVQDRILHLTAFLSEKLQAMGATLLSPTREEQRSGIVSFALSEDDAPLHQALIRKKIFLSYRLKHLRASPHFYNTEDELLAVVDALKKQRG